MKPIRAQNQVRLGANRCLGLAISGMSYRLFRASITISILALAVAFLIHTVSYGILSREAKAEASRELGLERALGEQLTRLSKTAGEADVMSAFLTGDTTQLRSALPLEATELKKLTDFARRASASSLINRLIRLPDVRAAVARKTGLGIAEISLENLGEYVDSQAHAAWLFGVLEAARERGTAAQSVTSPVTAEPPAPSAEVHTVEETEVALTADVIYDFFKQQRRGRELSRVVDATPPKVVWLGLDERTLWLIVLSLLVCIVGVANALLMSVTERFTEIATMKCLGAMDGFVMTMFIFEAGIQGALGGFLGIILGNGLALLRGAFEFGVLLASATTAVGEILLSCLACLGLGIALAALAAVGPAAFAARLPPMEAMRVD